MSCELERGEVETLLEMTTNFEFAYSLVVRRMRLTTGCERIQCLRIRSIELYILDKAIAN